MRVRRSQLSQLMSTSQHTPNRARAWLDYAASTTSCLRMEGEEEDPAGEGNDAAAASSINNDVDNDDPQVTNERAFLWLTHELIERLLATSEWAEQDLPEQVDERWGAVNRAGVLGDFDPFGHPGHFFEVKGLILRDPAFRVGTCTQVTSVAVTAAAEEEEDKGRAARVRVMTPALEALAVDVGSGAWASGADDELEGEAAELRFQRAERVFALLAHLQMHRQTLRTAALLEDFDRALFFGQGATRTQSSPHDWVHEEEEGEAPAASSSSSSSSSDNFLRWKEGFNETAREASSTQEEFDEFGHKLAPKAKLDRRWFWQRLLKLEPKKARLFFYAYTGSMACMFLAGMNEKQVAFATLCLLVNVLPMLSDRDRR
jgi:hypothetical protein